MYNVPPEIAGSVTLIKVSLSVQYIQLEQIYKVPEKSERCITILLKNKWTADSTKNDQTAAC